MALERPPEFPQATFQIPTFHGFNVHVSVYRGKFVGPPGNYSTDLHGFSRDPPSRPFKIAGMKPGRIPARCRGAKGDAEVAW